jgi:hypothetical protein
VGHLFIPLTHLFFFEKSEVPTELRLKKLHVFVILFEGLLAVKQYGVEVGLLVIGAIPKLNFLFEWLVFVRLYRLLLALK